MQGKKTGVINDTFMLKHKTKKAHPQKPKRVEEVMQRLKQTGILDHPKVDFISQYDRFVSDEQINYAHSTKYLNYFNNIWPKETHRHDMTVIDTYLCQHSNKVARIAAGGVILGIDKVMTGEWKNGFAVIRPPGHHAGVRNILNGFCLLNNAAIGARHIQKKYGAKKVAILDWDVHRGDGTHTIFESDRDVLFISVHRYDHGIYYPSGEQGNYDNCGKGDAEGTKVNIPLNHYDQNYTPYNCQSAGDNEYVYIFNRIIFPILKQFDPQFLIISSGFDASRFDPLGDFTVTPNGFYYMARRLAESGIKVLSILEGGYNPEQLALGVDAVIHGLLSEDSLPEPVDKINFDNMKDLCQVNEEYHKDIDKIIEFHSKYYKSLQSQELIKYTERIKSNKERLYGIINQADDTYTSSSEQDEEEEETKPQSDKIDPKYIAQPAKKAKNSTEQLAQLLSKANNKQQTSKQQEDSEQEESNQFCFACGHMQRFKNFSINNEKVFKLAYPEEHDFYAKQYPEAQFAPKYFGKDAKYIVLENMLYKIEDHVVADFKIGRFSKKQGLSSKRLEKELKKENASSTSKYAFRLSGFTTPTYKQGGLLVSDENVIRKMFEKLVTAENKAYYCDFLTRLAETLRKANRKYYNTSIFISKGKNRSTIKWIDFHYWDDNCDSYDEQSIEGLENMRKFIEEVNVNESHQ